MALTWMRAIVAAMLLPHCAARAARPAGLKALLLRTRAGASSSASTTSSSTSALHMASSTSTTSSTTTSPAAAADKLAALRRALAASQVDCFIVPTDDPHMSEYTALHYNRREWLSGFTGSAGTAVVTQTDALLFTDGRYHNQAELELPKDHWTLMRQGLKEVPSPVEWIAKTLPAGAVVGVDPFLHGATGMAKIKETLAPKGITVHPLPANPIDALWTVDGGRPAPPAGPLRVHPLAHAGKSVAEKLGDVRAALVKAEAAALVVASLDEVAWLFNVRGCDVPCNPVGVAYAAVAADGAWLFVDAHKVPADVQAHLAAAGVVVMPYREALAFVEALGSRDGKVWLDGKTVNHALTNAVPAHHRIERESPITLMKAVKNAAELAGMRACHLRDGAAVAEFFAWLEEELPRRGGSGAEAITEVELDERVTASRAALSPGTFLEPSFPTIAGVNSNGAIVHYRAVVETAKALSPGGDLVLLDSGGQYTDGTTDVTRTFHTGTPTAQQVEMFTRVLKGHIAVDSRTFIAGTAGCMLDAYAREHLWAIGKDYIHGTGHGVGAALNVHEGPHSISRVLNAAPLVPGMVVSNEPGYYEAGAYGIRIENLLVVVEKAALGEFGGRAFYGFERLTHIPIQKRLMDLSLLTEAEVAWVDTYHREVWERVGPLMHTDRGKKWLREATAPLRGSTAGSAVAGDTATGRKIFF